MRSLQPKEIRVGKEVWYAKVSFGSKISKNSNFLHSVEMPKKAKITGEDTCYCIVEDSNGYTHWIEKRWLFNTELDALEEMSEYLSICQYWLDYSYKTQKTTLEKKLILRK